MGCAIEILALQARILLEDAQEVRAMIALGRALSLAEPGGSSLTRPRPTRS